MSTSILSWTSITDFGDSAVGLSLAALVLVALFASGWSRGAVAWACAIAGCGAAMAVFKVAFKAASAGCAPVVQAAPAFSPSGHAALSAVVYGGLAVLGGRQLPPLARVLIGLGTAIWIGLIAGSRVAVQAHTPIEVVTGLVVGLGAVALMIHMLKQSAGPRLLLPQLAVASTAALLLTYGAHWQIEASLRIVADLLHRSVACAH
jgi:membrane-associated phospholipid phosphatase